MNLGPITLGNTITTKLSNQGLPRYGQVQNTEPNNPQGPNISCCVFANKPYNCTISSDISSNLFAEAV